MDKRKWIDPRFYIAGFSNEDDSWQEFRIQSSRLHGLAVHDLHEKKGERLVWLNELGEISTSHVLGRLKVRYLDLRQIDPAIAWRAKLTSSDDPEEELEAVRNGRTTPDPEFVWLGVQYHRQAKSSHDDPSLPAWANGVEIIESEDVTGCFGVVGYTTKGGEKYFDFAKDYYCELLVREY